MNFDKRKTGFLGKIETVTTKNGKVCTGAALF